MADRFYPSLDSLISLDSLPSELDFLQEILSDVFSRMYYRNFNQLSSNEASSASYVLELVLFDALHLDIPGVGLSLSLNEDFSGSSDISVIPIDLSWELPILKYSSGFNIKDFDFSPNSFYDLFFRIHPYKDTELVFATATFFIGGTSPLEDFATHVNSTYGTSISLPLDSDTDTALHQIVDAIHSNQPPSVREIVFNDYLTGSTIEESFDKLNQLFGLNLNRDIKNDIQKLFEPRLSARLILNPAIVFSRDILIPLDNNLNPTSGKTKLELGSGVEFYYSSNGSFGIDTSLSATLTPTKSQIGNTGLVISFTNAFVDLSSTTNIPQATAAGYGDEFKGVFVEEASIGLPHLFQDDPNQPNSGIEIVGKNLLIGTGGFSGTVALEVTGQQDTLYQKIGAFGIGFSAFSATFRQNAITECSIAGALTIPGFKKNNTGDSATVAIQATFDTHGDFKITADTSQLLDDIGIKDVFTVSITRLTVEKDSDSFYVELAGSLDLIADIPVLGSVLPKGIEIDSLRIYDDGSFEFVGGVIFPARPFSIDLGPVHLTVSAISFGTEERGGRQYAWFGFDAALNMNPKAIEARGNGIKVYFSIDNGPLDIFIRLESIGIDIMLPANTSPDDAIILLSGYLSVKNPDPSDPNSSTSYFGSVSASIPPVHIKASVGMAYTPSIPSFAADVKVGLPAPLPLGPTGLGIYEFRGLFGQHYIADKEAAGLSEDANWIDYYRVPPMGVNLDKFDNTEGFSLGAGVGVGTAMDGGKTFNANVFFLLSLPRVFLLEGRGAILKKMSGLNATDEPPFYAMLAIDSNSVEAAFGVDMKLPDSGKIANLQGEIDAGFFFHNSSAWYVNIGQEYPESKRVTAELFTLFQAYFFLMINNTRIRAGAGADWVFDKHYGPVSISAGANLDVRGFLHYNPTQIGGSISLGAHLSVKVFGFGFGFQIGAGLSAEASKPFFIAGYFHLKIGLPWPFKDIKIKIDFVWNFNEQYHDEEIPIFRPDRVANTVNVRTGESFPVKVVNSLPANPSAFDDYTVPQDSYIDIQFLESVRVGNDSSLDRIGGNYANPRYAQKVPPRKTQHEQVRHELSLEEFHIYSWNPNTNQWEAYDMYRAMVDQNGQSHPDLPQVTQNQLDNMKFAFWQLMAPHDYRRIRVLSQTPFSYMEEMSGNNPSENFGIESGDIFCEDDPIPPTCINWDAPGAYGFYAEQTGNINGTLFYVEDENADKVAHPQFGFTNALRLRAGNTLRIDFDETVSETTLKLSTVNDGNVHLTYFERVPDGVDYNGLQLYNWNQIETKDLAPAQLGNPVSYDNTGGIDRIVIDAPSCTRKICGPTYEGQLFLSMLNQMLKDGYFKKGEYPLSIPEYALYYDQLFPDVPSGRMTFKVKTADGLNLNGVLVAEGLNCPIIIELIKPSELSGNFTQISPFFNLRDNPHDSSPNSFYMDALYENDKVLTFAVSCRCISAIQCKEEEFEDINQCPTYLHELCYLKLEDAIANGNISDQNQIDNQNGSIATSINHTLTPIWRPFTTYAIQLKTKDVLSGPVSQVYDREFVVGFNTKGPMGDFQLHSQRYADLLPDKTDKFKLKDLKYYIDYNKSYPSPSGNVLNAKPLYLLNPEINIYYLKNYVTAMYNTWKAYNGNSEVTANLEVKICDPLPAQSTTQTVAVSNFQLTQTATPPNTADINVMNNLYQFGEPCGNMNPLEVPEFKLHLDLDSLKPLKMYSVVIIAHFPTHTAHEKFEIFRYTFQTSRYESLVEHLDSFVLSANEKAFYPVEVNDLSSDLAQIQEIMDGNLPESDPLHKNYANDFEKITTGIIKLSANNSPVSSTPPPTGVEVNLLKKGNTHYALWIRSPEPINDPRTPKTEKPNTIAITVDTNPLANAKILFSEDMSEVFITTAASSVPTGDYEITFNYLLFDGQEYSTKDSSSLNFTIS